MIEVEVGDTIVEFPDNTPRDVMLNALRRRFGSQQPQQQPQQQVNTVAKANPQGQRDFSGLESAILGTANGYLQNFGAEAAGVIGALVEGFGREEGFGPAYQRISKAAGEMLQQAQQANPASFTGGEIAGAITTAAVPGAAALRGGTAAAKAAKLAGAGAAQGALFGAGEDGTVEQRVNSAAKGAAFGAAAGVAAPAVGRQAGQLIAKVLGKNKGAGVPEISQIKEAAQALYARSKEAGVMVRPEKIDDILDDLGALAQRKGAAPGLTDKPIAALNELNTRRGAPMSLEGVDQMRQILQNGIDINNPNANRIIGDLVERLDDQLDRLSPRDVLANANRSKTAIRDLKDARGLWKRLRKSEIIEEAFERARNAEGQFTQSGFENTIRAQFKRIAENKKLFRQFTPEEKAAIMRVVRGTKGQTLIRNLGKLAPNGVVSSLPSILIGAGAGPAAGVGVALAGKAAHGAATRMRVRDAEGARNLVRAGQALPQPDNALAQALAARGLIGAGSVGAQEVPIDLINLRRGGLASTP